MGRCESGAARFACASCDAANKRATGRELGIALKLWLLLGSSAMFGWRMSKQGWEAVTNTKTPGRSMSIRDVLGEMRQGGVCQLGLIFVAEGVQRFG